MELYAKAYELVGKIRILFPGDLRIQESVGLMPLGYVDYLLKSGDLCEAEVILREESNWIEDFVNKFPTSDLGFQQKRFLDSLKYGILSFKDG